MIRPLHLALVLGALACLPSRCLANGRFPAAQYILVGPGREGRTVALMTTFGPVVSDDGAATFHWICEQALEYPGGQWDAAMGIDARGALDFGLPTGLVRAAPGRCSFAREPALEGSSVVDLDQSDDGERVVAAAVSGDASGLRGRLFAAVNGGEFAPLGDAMPGVLFTTLEMARSDRARLYATAQTGDDQRPTFLRSDDGGATLREIAFALDAPLDLRAAFVAAIDPARADTVYVRALLASRADGGGVEPSALLRTDDGGRSFRVIARTEGPMRGFAISDDGRTVWIGSPAASEGLQRSDDGGRTFRRVAEMAVHGLRFHAGALYVSTDFTRTGYALARSRDGGATLEPLVRFEDVAGAFACGSPSPERDVCAPGWPTLRAMSFPGPARGAAKRDAGVVAPVEAPRGCACVRPSSGGRASATAVMLALMAVAARRRVNRGTCRCRPAPVSRWCSRRTPTRATEAPRCR